MRAAAQLRLLVAAAARAAAAAGGSLAGQCAVGCGAAGPAAEELEDVAAGAGEHLLLQRRLRQSQAALSLTPASPYDCNGDGVDDCGKWDYQLARCANRVYCGHSYKYPDATLDQACRCRRCSDPTYNGTAVWDPALRSRGANESFNALAWGTFRNWAGHQDTCAPWVMPRDDAALQKLLAYARGKGYKVRISGAAHSAGGLVTDGADSQVLVLSLAEYTAPGEWEFGLRDMPDGSKRATVNAGWTQLHLYAHIRPLGYFLPAQTAGYFFALGGIVANSVHGGAYNQGFIHSYVTRMRVMIYDGTVRIIEAEEELRYWRNSFGLLGIILGVEFQLEKRDRLHMYTLEKQLDRWSAEELWKFVKGDAEADLAPEVVTEGGSNGTRASWNGEYFVDFVNGDRPTMQVYAQKSNASVQEGGEAPASAERLQAEYWAQLLEDVEDGWHGWMSYSEAARRDGAPPIEVLGVDVNDLIRHFRTRELAKIMSKQAIVNIPRLVRTQSHKVNDGFFLVRSPAALAAAYFVEPTQAFAAMDFLRQRQLESFREGGGEFVWSLPGEFRFVRVRDSAVLQPVPPGLWCNVQMIAFEDLARSAQGWKRAFKTVEDYWVKGLGAKPHLGKLWGFEAGQSGQVEPFANAFACTIYSEEQKAAFSAHRARADPEGLFASGLGTRFLAPCTGNE